ncbi:MAG TPA: aminoacyl-tRNA hydrolase [Methylomirabilota bacterium]|nr:aminoacyl-tRNA hydrolase [Methylomirabilota bacterium]
MGLGNPGPCYARSRHNAGFMAVSRLAEAWQVPWSMERRFQSRVARANRGGKAVLLCQPQTFMNLSGEAVAALRGFYHVSLDRLLVIVDDADLPLGALRMRAEGRSGGHHGLESIEQHLGTGSYARQRIGIGRTADGRREITGHVLSDFTADEIAVLEKVLTRACDQIECWLAHGVQRAMNQYNGVIASEERQ